MNKTTVPFVKNCASNSSIASHMIKPEMNLVIFIVHLYKLLRIISLLKKQWGILGSLMTDSFYHMFSTYFVKTQSSL